MPGHERKIASHKSLYRKSQTLNKCCGSVQTLANHGYIDRSGIVTFQQLIQGQKDLYNVDYDVRAPSLYSHFWQYD